jgi:hypothetical protein
MADADPGVGLFLAGGVGTEIIEGGAQDKSIISHMKGKGISPQDVGEKTCA